MSKQLIILTGEDGREQARDSRMEAMGTEIVDLTSDDADYGELVQRIFEADSVHVW